MNLFKKALIAVLGLGLVVAPSANRHVEEVHAATTKTIYLHTGGSSLWNQAGAYFWVHSWGSTTEDTKMVATKDKDIFKVDVNASNNSIIFCRNNPANTTIPWNGVWNQTADLTIPSGKNMYTITGWRQSEGKWSSYTEPTTTYTVSYYDGTTKLDSAEFNEGAELTVIFNEKEGYRLEGWYSDAALTKKLTGTETVNGDISVYAKYVAAEDYKVYLDDNEVFGDTVYAYAWRDSTDGGKNAEWPGVALTKDENGLWRYDVDSSQTYTKIIFNGGQDKEQTVDLELTYENSLYTLGEKTEGKYDSTVSKYNHLNVYYQEKGANSVRFISTFGVVDSDYFALESYENVGFKVESGDNSKEVNAGFIYTSVVADGETISAANYNAQYFFVLTFNNIPTGTTFTVTPYATLTSGTVYYGTSVVYTVA